MTTAADIVYLFQEAAQAVSEEDSARREYDGYSWGYHGYPFVEARRKAEERAQEALDAYIDARIDAKLAAFKETV